MIQLIFKPFQREVAMLGEVIKESTSSGTSHHGVWSNTTKTFEVGGKQFNGDYATAKFTSKNCLMFKKIITEYEPSQNIS